MACFCALYHCELPRKLAAVHSPNRPLDEAALYSRRSRLAERRAERNFAVSYKKEEAATPDGKADGWNLPALSEKTLRGALVGRNEAAPCLADTGCRYRRLRTHRWKRRRTLATRGWTTSMKCYPADNDQRWKRKQDETVGEPVDETARSAPDDKHRRLKTDRLEKLTTPAGGDWRKYRE